MGIFEILLFLVIALIVIPPDDLPQVMRAVGKVMRELRLASNTVMREISGAIGDDAPFNILPPRFDDPHPPPMPPSSPSPAPPAFLAPEIQPQPPTESPPGALPAQAPQAAATGPLSAAEHQASNEPTAEPASAPSPSSASPQDATRPRATGELTSAEHQAQAEPQTPPRPRRTRKPKQPSPRERSLPPADKP
ncbi:MAG TPA: twin-arginine translocase TatA/TatE family subunit [Candidatus Binataceae bacterium]|nr:twin-arginine translocase TatA/TatE family subunit [Candidatus Binataceae bacterium]